MDLGATDGVVGTIPPPLGGGGVVLGAGLAFVALGGGFKGGVLFRGGGGMAPSHESSNSKRLLGFCLPFLPPFLVAGGWGGRFGLGGGGSLFLQPFLTLPFLIIATIPAHTPSYSAPLYPTCPILAHSPAL